MKLLLPFLLAVSSVKSVPTEVVTDSTIPPSTTIEAVPTYDYIVEIGFNLNQDKVPEYLVNTIYDQPVNKTITTDDIFTLYGLKTVDRTTTLDFLEKLNISAEKIFSLDGLDKFLTELSIDFKQFYNRVIIDRLNVTGNPLREVLITLNIDINNFSIAMAYGDPDPYEEFKKGNYTYETVTLALEQANRTLDDLFVACRDEFVEKALTINSKTIVEILLRYQFDRTAALNLWHILGLTTEDVYRTEGFRQLLEDLSRELNKVPSLGVLTGPNSITINRKVYESWKDDEVVVQPFAESVSHKFILQIVEKKNTELRNIIQLTTRAVEPYEEDVTYIEIGKIKGTIRNCKFVTLNNETIVTADVDSVSSHGDHMHIPKNNVTELIVGSPLICNDRVYGLARELNEEEIILDTFSSVDKIFSSGFLLGVALTVFVCAYFL